MSIVELVEPERAPDATNYRVVLSPKAENQFLASAALRETAMATWKERAVARGRRRVIVQGRYHQLVQEDV